MKTYKHLNQEERDLIAVLIGRKWSLHDIARRLKRNPSTIKREIDRNTPKKGSAIYLSHKAQERADIRHCQGHKRKRLKTYALRMEVENLLLQGWSPEIISGRLALEGRLPKVNPESIYQWIYSEKPYLAGYLPRAHRRRYPKHRGRKHRKERIPERISVLERPEAVNRRLEPGHWETDLLVGCGSNALQVSVERMSRLTRLKPLKDKTSEESSEALINMFASVPENMRRSVTYDNGSENVQHLKIKSRFGIASYFCEPYHSWEKGTVENTNGLIRRFIPKRADLSKIQGKDIEKIEAWLNARPRKCLKFRTPAEVFDAQGVALTG